MQIFTNSVKMRFAHFVSILTHLVKMFYAFRELILYSQSYFSHIGIVINNVINIIIMFNRILRSNIRGHVNTIFTHYVLYRSTFIDTVCGTLKCKNAFIYEKVAKCENISTLNVKIGAICDKCEQIRLSK